MSPSTLLAAKRSAAVEGIKMKSMRHDSTHRRYALFLRRNVPLELALGIAVQQREVLLLHRSTHRKGADMAVCAALVLIELRVSHFVHIHLSTAWPRSPLPDPLVKLRTNHQPSLNILHPAVCLAPDTSISPHHPADEINA